MIIFTDYFAIKFVAGLLFCINEHSHSRQAQTDCTANFLQDKQIFAVPVPHVFSLKREITIIKFDDDDEKRKLNTTFQEVLNDKSVSENIQHNYPQDLLQ